MFRLSRLRQCHGPHLPAWWHCNLDLPPSKSTAAACWKRLNYFGNSQQFDINQTWQILLHPGWAMKRKVESPLYVCLPNTHGRCPCQLPPAHSAENMAPAQNMLMINPALKRSNVYNGGTGESSMNPIGLSMQIGLYIDYKPVILGTSILGNLHVGYCGFKGKTPIGNMHETMKPWIHRSEYRWRLDRFLAETVHQIPKSSDTKS